MTNKEEAEILKLYKQRLDESCSNLLDRDKEAFDLAIKVLEQTNNSNDTDRVRHDLAYYSEEDNACNMEELMTVEFYQSEKTGKIYCEFISSDEGCWKTTKEIYPDEYDNLKSALNSFV